jgi:hypothetical protein
VNDSSDDFFEMAEAQGLDHLRLHRRDGLIDSMNVARVTVIAISLQSLDGNRDRSVAKKRSLKIRGRYESRRECFLAGNRLSRDSSWGAPNPSRFPQQTGIPQTSGWAANLSRIFSANCEWPIHCIRKSGLRIHAERGFASAVRFELSTLIR